MKNKRLISLLLALVMCLSLVPMVAMANEPPEAAPHQYLSDLKLHRSGSNENKLYAKSDGLPEPHIFNANQTTYDIMLVDINPMTFVPVVTATLKEEFKPSGLYGALSSTATPNSTLELFSSWALYSGGSYTSTAMVLKNAGGFNDLTMTSAAPSTVYFITGNCSQSGTNITYTNTDVYKFNFYRKATLKSFSVAYENGTAITDGIPSKFDPYLNNYEIVGVAAGTEKLDITAPAYTQTATTLKFDDGTGEFVADKTDTTGTKFTLDLTKYDNEYEQADGSLVIPFVLDYTGNGCGVDGYYTLTVSFTEEESTPVITADATAEVDVDELADWEPEYSAVDAGGVDATSSVTLTYYEVNGTTPLTDMDAVVTYIGDAKTNDTFVVKFSLMGADDVTMTVTVNPEEQMPGGSLQGSYANGFVENFKIQRNVISAEYDIFFDEFVQSTTVYTVEVPYRHRTTSPASLSLILETDPEKKLNCNVSVANSEGSVLYSVATFKIENSIVDIRDKAAYLINSLTNYFPMGEERAIRLCVYEDGKRDDGDIYFFFLNRTPELTAFRAYAEGTALTVNLRHREFFVPAPGVEKIILKGTVDKDAKLMFENEDLTAAFSGDDGTEIDLLKLEKYKNGDVYTIPFSVIYDFGTVEVRSDYTVKVYAGAANDWTITGHPASGTYNKGDKVTLSVIVEGDDANIVSYQWQWARYTSSVVPNDSMFTDIDGATTSSFEPETVVGGRRWLRCVITDPETGVIQKSEAATIIVNLGQVNDPEIVIQPGIYANISNSNDMTDYKKEYTEGQTINTIQIAAGTAEGTDLNNSPTKVEFEWFYNDKNSYDGATALDPANYGVGDGIHYIRDVDNIGNYVSGQISNYNVTEKLSVGKHYYFCEVTVVDKADETNRSTTIRSDILEITVLKREELDGFEGLGTETSPYLIKTVDHLSAIDGYVLSGDFLEGAVFKFDNDITLPQNWEPIGANGPGSSGIGLLPFSGIIDGGGYTLTVAEGGKPLLEYTRDATVKNLKIYGEDINGAGLLDKVIVDYGTDGIYQQYTDPDIITVENVTLLSGSNTRGSGLVNGGWSSGINNIYIRDCTIEEGVVVGYNRDQSAIGSFVGTLNGRIENSVSYATVYGTTKVGGLAGVKGQSMGDCSIINSAFLGTIEATGGKVGGILGSGYISASAPNTPPVTIRNCYVAANITGNSALNIELGGYDMGSGIGGILGSEIGLRGAMNYAYISDNFFYGTITDANTTNSRAGGILGELGYYNPKYLTYADNYYLENSSYTGISYQVYSNDDWTPNEDSFIAKTANKFADGTVLNLLMDGKNSFKNWMQEDDALYPVHDPNAEPRIYALEISGEFKVVYYVGEELDTTGMNLTALYTITGDEVEVDLKEAAFSGYNSNVVGNQDVTVTYEGVSAIFTVSVIRRYDNGGGTPGVDPGEDTICVKFALIGSTTSDGDIDLGNEDLLYRGASYETWIGLTEYKMAEDATVLELFDRALKQANIPYTIKSMNNYVDSINDLAEFTNGPRSGWMYTVGQKDNGSDGSHPDLGLREYVLNDGDVIIWHYVNDYSYEVHDWFDEPGYPSSGKDGKYYSLWLKALASGSYTLPSGTGAAETKTTTISPKVTAKDGVAAVTVSTSDMSTAIADAKKNGSSAIVIEPEISGKANKMTVELPKASLSAVASDTDASLKIVTSSGNVAIPNDVLVSIASQAAGTNVIVSLETVETKALTPEQQKVVGDDTVYDISITSGGKAISGFDGKSLTIALPYTLKSGEKADGVTVWYLNDVGKLERMNGKYDTSTKLVTFTTTHLSKYVVGYETPWANPFADVESTDWFYDAVKYAVQNELFSGTSATTFSPNSDVTRAMLVTVLYRLEGKPAVTGTNTFSDVKSGEWYTDAILWANANKLVEGYGNGLFGTNDSITREQMAAILYRYAQMKGYSTTKTTDLAKYTDAATVNIWADAALNWTVAESFITGRTATTLTPAGTASRAEVATILMRFAESMVK